VKPEPLPRAAEVYERVVDGIGPRLSELGCKSRHAGRFPWWYRDHPSAGDRVFLSAQVDRHATDPYSGGSLALELEKASPATRTPNTGLTGRALFFQLLRDAELDVLLAHQNRIIADLEPPPPEQVELYPAGRVRRMYQSYFEQQDGFDVIRSWLRYRDLRDVDSWMQVLRPYLGVMLDRAQSVLDVQTMSLGEGSLV